MNTLYRFFLQPKEHKMQFRLGKYGCPEGGYSPVGAELVSLSLEENPDAKVVPVDPIEAIAFTTSPDNYKLRDVDLSSQFPHAEGNVE